MRFKTIFVLSYLTLCLSETIYDPYNTQHIMINAEVCNEQLCQLPQCRCSKTDIPGNLTSKNVPQIVLFTFYTSLTRQDFGLITKKLFHKRFNPNGCQMTASFYITHANTDYKNVAELYDAGNEIAVNSISFRSPSTWWSAAKVEDWKEEMEGQRQILSKFGNVSKSDIVGIQAPHLQQGGDNMYRMMEEEGFLYNSWPTLKFMDRPLWPYTLDYKSIQDCPIGRCPTKQHNGIWVIPFSYFKSKTGRECEIVAACDGVDDEDDAYDLLNTNFIKHYSSNRAPFTITISSEWLQKGSNVEGLDRFILKLDRMNDVYVINNYQAIQWIKNPIPLSQVQNFSPWLQCLEDRTGITCDTHQSKCFYKVSSVEKVMTTCQSCPKAYPCVGNPLGEEGKTCIY